MLALTLLRLINTAFQLYSLALVAYAILTWFPNARFSKPFTILEALVRPYLNFFDRLIPSIGGISFSVLVGIFVLDFIRKGLLTLLITILR
ncbi:TPA: YggT family protein [Streptococcus suis]